MSEGQKNTTRIVCSNCPSIILQPGAGTRHHTEFRLPHFHKKTDETAEEELITNCWMVPDMFHFENVGFSNTVGNFKYLTCADCELGPIGWHQIDTKLSYLADRRVKHCEP